MKTIFCNVVFGYSKCYNLVGWLINTRLFIGRFKSYTGFPNTKLEPGVSAYIPGYKQDQASQKCNFWLFLLTLSSNMVGSGLSYTTSLNTALGS